MPAERLAPLNEAERRDFWRIREDRYHTRSRRPASVPLLSDFRVLHYLMEDVHQLLRLRTGELLEP